jgi:CRISPR system Cascade subunit CasE
MIYLSQLTLNRRSRQVRQELNDPYQMHRTLSKALGDDKQLYREARLLFRVEESQRTNRLCVLVQTLLPPDWQAVGNDDYFQEMPQMKAFDPTFRAGQSLFFRLRANPTKRVDGKRLGLYKEEEALQWVERQAGANGFQITRLVCSPLSKSTAKNGQGSQSTFCVARFDGTLRVLEPDKFMNVLKQGIGSGKGYGFGLLTVAAR